MATVFQMISKSALRYNGGAAVRKRITSSTGGMLLLLALLCAAVLLRDATAAQSSSTTLGVAASIDTPVVVNPEQRPEIGAAPRATDGIIPRSGMTVVILSGAGRFALAIKVGDQIIELPGPSSWPRETDDAKSGFNKSRFIAVLIDTADILKANGFSPDTPFSFVVNGAEMNVKNTQRLVTAESMTGKLPDQTRDDGMAWSAFRFRNVVASHGEIPSMSDYLVAPRIAASRNAASDGAKLPAPTASTLPSSTYAPSGYHNDVPQVTPLERPSPENTRKYIEALHSPDPAVRADAIENLIINGDEQFLGTQDVPKPGSAVDKTTSDNNSATNDQTQDAAHSLDESLSQEALSGIAIHDKDPQVRMQALDQLVERFGSQAAPTIKEALQDPDPRVARMANALMFDMEGQDQ